MLSIDKYWNLISKIDDYCSEWSTRPPIPLKCHPGCDECCHSRFTLFAVEVAAIQEALREKGDRELPARVTNGRRSNGDCPFLDRNHCLIYEVRPILCRTQGFPFLFLDDKGRWSSHICSHNRVGRELNIPSRFVLDLETLNNCLSSLNYLYLAEMEEQGHVMPARLDILRILEEEAGGTEE